MIKVIANEKGKDNAIDFPKLMIYLNGEIVLATSVSGTNVTGFSIFDPSKAHPVGYYSDKWAANRASDYTGEITLKNEMQWPDQSENDE